MSYNEADTRANLIDPKISEAGWDNNLISREYPISAGRIEIIGETHRRAAPRKAKNPTAKEYEKLQSGAIMGQEKKPVPFLLGVMNCILHDLYGAKLTRGNAFAKNIRQIEPSERVDIVLSNPPFGGEEESTLLENFPYPASATQVLAVQYILRRLKPGGRCGMVLDEGFLSRINEKAFVNTKKELWRGNRTSLWQGYHSTRPQAEWQISDIWRKWRVRTN